MLHTLNLSHTILLYSYSTRCRSGAVSADVKTTENGDLRDVPRHNTAHEMNNLDLPEAPVDRR